MRTETPTIVRLEDYRPTDYRIPRVALDVRLEPEATRVRARLDIVRRDGTPAGAPLHLDGDELRLAGLALDGVSLASDAYAASPDRLTLYRPPPGPFALEIETELDPSGNTALMGLYRSNGVYTTQCEAEGFRRITYFLDRPDVLSVYTVRLEARASEAPVLLANGNRVETGAVPGTDRHFAVWHDPFPKPCYLFALVGGDLGRIDDRFRTMSGRDVALSIFCEHGREERCRYAMDALKRSMAWDERAFGREYDLDCFNIVAVSDFNMGAMENKGLNIFNDKYVLADVDTATDTDFALIEAVIAHEYFHNWTGNRITCRDWFQLSLKEGLTVYRDQEFTADERSRALERIGDVANLRRAQFPEDAGPLAHPVRPTAYREINNFYTATVYEKGAEVVRMLEAIHGRDGFRRALDLYFERHDGDAATVEDFLACFRDTGGRDLNQFARWYSQAGTPTLRIRRIAGPEAERLVLDIEQVLPATADGSAGDPFHIPVRFGLVDAQGDDRTTSRVAGVEVDGDVIHLRERRTRITFEGLDAPVVPSLLRGFSAPVIKDEDLSDDERLFLAARDRDPLNRWDALQAVALVWLKAASRTVGGERPSAVPAAFLEALGRTVADESLDPAFRARAISPPTEAEIAQALGTDVDTDAVLAARTALLRTIADALAPEIGAAAARNRPADVYRPDGAEAGRRSLAALADEFRLLADPAFGSELAARFPAASSLTERLSVLRTLLHHGHPMAGDVLGAFETRYRDQPLVLDKWFAVQATAPGHQTMHTVESLLHHDRFSLRTPNRVYALILSFGANNPSAFNRPDGAGYRFLAERILEIDRLNPSVAARLATVFRSWRTLEPTRRAQASQAIERIAESEHASRNVRDIVLRLRDAPAGS